MNVSELKAGDRVQTIDGTLAEVLKESEDGRWILVRYVAHASDPKLIGTEDLCSEDEIEVRMTS